jgi:hypothetical protein
MVDLYNLYNSVSVGLESQQAVSAELLCVRVCVVSHSLSDPCMKSFPGRGICWRILGVGKELAHCRQGFR